MERDRPRINDSKLNEIVDLYRRMNFSIVKSVIILVLFQLAWVESQFLNIFKHKIDPKKICYMACR